MSNSVLTGSTAGWSTTAVVAYCAEIPHVCRRWPTPPCRGRGCSGGFARGRGCAPEEERRSDAGSTKTVAVATRGEGFDFYVLALSWSPSYCEAEGEDANRRQCAGGRPYAFVVHGLWPQFERGYPQECPTNEPGVRKETQRELYDLMPSAGLIRHQWRKHGSCAGLSQRDYFRVLRQARERVRVPAEFDRLETYRALDPNNAETAFLKANPGLSAGGVAVTCDKRYLREVRICMNKDLSFRSSDEIDRRACRLPKVVMPPVRGG